MFMILVVIMTLQVFTYVKINQTAHFKHMQLIVYKLQLNKSRALITKILKTQKSVNKEIKIAYVFTIQK